MKLGNTVLVEIVNAFQEGIVEGVDVSDKLREIDVGSVADDLTGKLELSQEYLREKGRLVVPEENQS